MDRFISKGGKASGPCLKASSIKRKITEKAMDW